MRRMLVIVNPRATALSDELRAQVLRTLERGYEVQSVQTQAQGHAVELARRGVQEGFDAVAAFGGDGTVNEAANGVISARDGGPERALTCIPAGQANIFAKMLGLPADARRAGERLVALADSWPARSVDLGVVNGRCFTFSSGVGVDASVTRRVDANPRLKARFGPWYYTWAVASALARRYLVRPPRMAVDVPGGGPSSRPAWCHDRRAERLSIHLLQEPPDRDRGVERARLRHASGRGAATRGPVDLPFLAFRALSERSRISAHPQVNAFSGVSELTVRSADGRGLPLQVDGDYLGEVTEARYSILPRRSERARVAASRRRASRGRRRRPTPCCAAG